MLGKGSKVKFVTFRERNLSVCESVIYEGSSTTSGQPQLTPRQIEENIVQLQELLTQMEKSTMDMVKDVDNKKKVRIIAVFTIQSENYTMYGEIRLLAKGSHACTNCRKMFFENVTEKAY